MNHWSPDIELNRMAPIMNLTQIWLMNVCCNQHTFWQKRLRCIFTDVTSATQCEGTAPVPVPVCRTTASDLEQTEFWTLFLIALDFGSLPINSWIQLNANVSSHYKFLTGTARPNKSPWHANLSPTVSFTFKLQYSKSLPVLDGFTFAQLLSVTKCKLTIVSLRSACWNKWQPSND